MFVLNVDLWNEEGTREVNLVRSSTSSQSATAVSYPYASITIADSSHSTYGQNIPPPSRDATYSLPHAANYPPEYQTQAPQAPQSTYNAQGNYRKDYPFCIDNLQTILINNCRLCSVSTYHIRPPDTVFSTASDVWLRCGAPWNGFWRIYGSKLPDENGRGRWPASGHVYTESHRQLGRKRLSPN